YNHIYRNTNTLSDFSRLNILSTSARAGVYLGEFCSVEIQASELEGSRHDHRCHRFFDIISPIGRRIGGGHPYFYNSETLSQVNAGRWGVGA
ncbi:MAG: hypothetical protein ABSA83_18715, partial [Verrucomicrobiota bacterium]